MGNVLATANFKVHGTTWDNKPYEATVKATLAESDAFKYGNGTCMSLQWSDRSELDLIDTRYSQVTVENFVDFAMAEIDARTNDTITVEKVL